MNEIGSHFYLGGKELNSVQALEKGEMPFEPRAADKRYFSTGRQAIRFCLRDIEAGRKVALLPEYTCRSVIQPFLQEGYDLHFYPVNKKLEVAVSVLNRLSRRYGASVVLFHPYFGFDTILEDTALEEGIFYILDATQSLYSSLAYHGVHYLIASIRKWGPFEDGALGAKLDGVFRNRDILPEDREPVRLMQQAFDLKARYLDQGEGSKEAFLGLYRQALHLFASRDQIFRMSGPAENRYASFDFQELKDRRRRNFQALLSFPQWQRIGRPVFSWLDDQTVPLYFPLYITQGSRGEFQAHLAERGIYAPVIWPVPPGHSLHGLSRDTLWIYEHLLVLPVDQRYQLADMDRIRRAAEAYPAGAGRDGA